MLSQQKYTIIMKEFLKISRNKVHSYVFYNCEYAHNHYTHFVQTQDG